MRSHANPYVRCNAWLFALCVVLLLPTLAQGNLFAQQGWSQSPQYAPNQYDPQPYANPNPPSGYPNTNQYPQNQYPPPQSYAQQTYPPVEQGSGYGPGYGGDPQSGYGQGQPPPQPLGPDQLEQLVAPIALYPDGLIVQILAAATYPAQVAGADHWLQAQGYAAPDQIAYAADAQPWDPSVKALTAFPQVLALMDHDLQWTTELGNAYYNQPQDVLQTIQVLRQRAQAAGTLQNTPQEELSYNQGYIQLAPPNPQVVYVPAYNPWVVYGSPIPPYPGFSLLGTIGSFFGTGLRYGAGIGLGAFSHTSFGWMGWALNWLTQSVFFHQSPYYSHSTSVAHWGSGGRGGYYGARQAGRFGQSGGYARAQNSYNRPANGYGMQTYGRNYASQPARTPQSYAYNRPVEPAIRSYAGSSYPRATPQNYAYNRPQTALPARPQSWAGTQQGWRAPATTTQRNDFGSRSYLSDRSFGGQRPYEFAGNRRFAESYAKPERSGGFHLFGGRGGESYHAPKPAKAPKAPKGYGGGGGHHFGGGHSGGHSSGGHRF